MKIFPAHIFGTLAVAFALAGCAPVGYVRDNTPPAQVTQDAAQCQFEIEMAQRGVPPLWYGNASQQSAYYLGAAIGAQIRQQRLRTLCMQAKGYTPFVIDQQAPMTAQATVPKEFQYPAYQINAAGQPGRGDIIPTQPARVGAAPALNPKEPSKYALQVEAMVKAGGCAPPAVAMTAKGAGTESFTVGCPNGVTMAVKCDVEACRVLQ